MSKHAVICRNDTKRTATWQNQQNKCVPIKTQISLGIRPAWSESSLCTQWVAKDLRFLHADSEDSDQTGRMPRLIWVFAGRTATLLVMSCRGSIKCVVIQIGMLIEISLCKESPPCPGQLPFVIYMITCTCIVIKLSSLLHWCVHCTPSEKERKKERKKEKIERKKGKERMKEIRSVAGQRSSPESGFANKTTTFFRAKNRKREITGPWNIGHCDLNLFWGRRSYYTDPFSKSTTFVHQTLCKI